MSKSEFHFNIFEDECHSSIFFSSLKQEENPFCMDQDDYKNSQTSEACFYQSNEPAYSLLDSFNNNGRYDDLIYTKQQSCLLIDQFQKKSDEQIIEEFMTLTAQERFKEARDLFETNSNCCSSYESQVLSISLMIFELFTSIKTGNNDKVQSVLKQIKSSHYYGGFNDSSMYLEILIATPSIFNTAFFSNKNKLDFVPAINQLAIQLLQRRELSSGTFARLEIAILENILEEMVFYMINYQRIYESTGDYDEIYLDFNTSYSRNNPLIKDMISEYLIEKEKQRSFNSRISLETVIDINPAIINDKKPHKLSNDRSHNSSLTLGSDETSDRSKEKSQEMITIEDLQNYKFTSTKKQTINKKNLKFFKQFLKTTVKAKGINYSSFIHDFCTNKLNPPVVVLDQKFTSCNDSYMIWLFSNTQITVLYLEYIEVYYDMAYDSISKECGMNNAKELLFLASYLKETAHLFSNPLDHSSSHKKVYKPRKKKEDDRTDTDIQMKSSSNIFRINTSLPNTEINEYTEQINNCCRPETENVQVIEFEISNLFGDANTDIYSA